MIQEGYRLPWYSNTLAMNCMSGKREPITYKGRSLGILTLTVAQLLIGALHLAVGVTLLAADDLSVGHGIVPYDVYTIAFAVLVLVFAAFIWQKKKQAGLGQLLCRFLSLPPTV